MNDEWLRSIREVLRPFLEEYTKTVANAMKPLQAYIAQVSREISKVTAGMSETMRPVLERLERYPGICMELGWPPFDVPLSVVARVVTLYDARGLDARADIDALFIKLISKRTIRSVLDEWRDSHLLRRRFHILDAAVGAHLKAQYALSVPVLLASIEGVVADLHGRAGRMTQKDTKRLLAETFSGPEGPARWSAALNDAARAVIVVVMVGSFVHGDPPPMDVRRNAVLHGADVAYDNEAYSLKAILMLDLVREQYGFVGLDGSPVFHRQACATLRRSSRSGHYYKTPGEADLDGKRACATCHPERRSA